MPDLANLAATLTVATCTAALKPPAADSPDPSSVAGAAASTPADSGRNLLPPAPASNGGELRVFRRRTPGANGKSKKASNSKTLEDHVRDWAEQKKRLGVSESRCSLPFLVGAKKMVDCLVCHSYVYPGEEAKCSVRGCRGLYHAKCVTNDPKPSNLKNFKCQQHACHICEKRPPNLRCMRCPAAWHNKCVPFPEGIISFADKPSHGICWRHDPDWRLDGKNKASTSSIESSRSNIEEIFCRLPLPYTDEEFKIDLTWKDIEIVEPPSYRHIKRNIYLVKKKLDDIADDGTGCTNCGTECCQSCVCRVQYVSCSKACRCSEHCKNRPFRKEKKIKIVKTEHCGWGVVAEESIDKGEFIVEYIGEVIDDAQCEKRLWDMKHKNLQNFYMCEIRKDFTIDATYKGNTSRFLNHGCNPNCVLEKWQVDRETRVGVFAARPIEVGESLTYDYRFVQFGPEVTCHCGALNCQGYLGTKKKIDKIELKITKLGWGTKRKRNSTACTGIITLRSKPIQTPLSL